MPMDYLSLESIYRLLEQEPEDVRAMFIYAVCTTMAEAGLLEYIGVSCEHTCPTTLLFRNPDTKAIVEIPKPSMTRDDEQAIKQRIRNLLYSESC